MNDQDLVVSSGRRTNYFMTDNAFVMHCMWKLTALEMRVYLALSMKANRNDQCRVSNAWIAKVCHIEDKSGEWRAVRRAISSLVDMGIIIRRERYSEDGKRMVNEYIVPRIASAEDEPDMSITVGPDTRTTPSGGPGQHCPPHPDNTVRVNNTLLNQYSSSDKSEEMNDAGASSNAHKSQSSKSTEDTHPDSLAAVAAPPTVPPTPPKRQRNGSALKEPTLAQHWAVRAYRDLAERYPAKPNAEAIANTVTDADLWDRAMRHVIGYSNSAHNVAFMLDMYRNPEKMNRGAQSHVRPNNARPAIPTREEFERSMELTPAQQRQLDAALEYRALIEAGIKPDYGPMSDM